MRALLSVTLFTAFVASLTGQSASATLYGTGCTYRNQALAMAVQGLPQLGTTFKITYSGPNFNSTLEIRPALALGLAAQNQPIPSNLLPQQPTGCNAWIDPLVITPMAPNTTGRFFSSVDVSIPNNPTLIGFNFFAQWIAIVTQCGTVPPCTLEALPTSNAVSLVVGT